MQQNDTTNRAPRRGVFARAATFGRRQADGRRVLFSETHGLRGLWVSAGQALHWRTWWRRPLGAVPAEDPWGEAFEAFASGFPTPAGVGSRADERDWPELFSGPEMLS